MTTTQVKPGPQDMLEEFGRNGANVYRAAYKEGKNLSVYLEERDPSDQYNDGLDAFQRLLKVAGVRTRGYSHTGMAASTWEEVYQNPQTRALLPEWMARQWRSVQKGKPYSTRDIYQSQDEVPGSWANPWTDASGARWDLRIAPQIPIDSLIALTTGINGDAYRAYYLTNNATQQGMTRVAEGAELPRVKLTGGEQTVRLYKYGRALEATYEQLRRQQLDKISLHIQRMAVQAEIDKLETVVTTLISGDGNNGTAATEYDISTIDSGWTSGLTLRGWLGFKMKFVSPYMGMIALAREATVLDAMLLNVGSANVPLVTIATPSGFGYFSAINEGLADNVRIGWTDTVPANKMLVFDPRFALERVVEIGGDVSEVERFTLNQTETLTISEVEGYAIMDSNAALVLDTAN